MFANYLLALPARKRLDVLALLVASALPDLEGLYYIPAAQAACGADFACMAAYPSHFMLHSFFGVFIVVGPLVALGLLHFRKKMKWKKFTILTIYLSAALGGLLHLLEDLTYHTGADSLYLLWPAGQQFSFAFANSGTFWAVLAGLGLFAFFWFEVRGLKV
ncbi:MAG: hypothetical protein V1887_04420 [Candidatus Aenigmatarchaeota archaeon]